METLIIHPENKEQTTIFKALAKAMKVSFEQKKEEYDPTFVANVLKAREDYKNGKCVEIPIEKLWD